MSTPAREATWVRLHGAGLVDGEIPAADRDRAPWFVRAMLGIAGWIGALFLFAFVATAFTVVMKSTLATVVLGIAACAVAFALFRAEPRGGDFTGQFGLAVSLAGQALLAIGLSQSFDRSLAGTAFTLAAVQALLFVLVRNFIHRVWTAWSGSYALSLALLDMGVQALVLAIVTGVFLAVWLREFDHPRHGDLLRPGGYGLALAAVQSAVLYGSPWHVVLWARTSHAVFDSRIVGWLGAAAVGAVLLWGVATLLRREGVAFASGSGKFALAAAAILALISLQAPGLGTASAILIIGYANGNRVLAGLGIAALLGYLSHYYYALDATLLNKSALLAAGGTALLAARVALLRWWPRAKGDAKHA